MREFTETELSVLIVIGVLLLGMLLMSLRIRELKQKLRSMERHADSQTTKACETTEKTLDRSSRGLSALLNENIFIPVGRFHKTLVAIDERLEREIHSWLDWKYTNLLTDDQKDWFIRIMSIFSFVEVPYGKEGIDGTIPVSFIHNPAYSTTHFEWTANLWTVTFDVGVGHITMHNVPNSLNWFEFDLPTYDMNIMVQKWKSENDDAFGASEWRRVSWHDILPTDIHVFTSMDDFKAFFNSLLTTNHHLKAAYNTRYISHNLVTDPSDTIRFNFDGDYSSDDPGPSFDLFAEGGAT